MRMGSYDGMQECRIENLFGNKMRHNINTAAVLFLVSHCRRFLVEYITDSVVPFANEWLMQMEYLRFSRNFQFDS